MLNVSFILADDWPTFGHDSARNSWAVSFAPDYDLYSAVGLTDSIALTAGDYVESTPVIKNNVMYVVAGQLDANNIFTTGTLYAFSLATNAKIWSVDFNLSSPKATPTVSDDGLTICHGGGNIFYCRNTLDGTVIWIQPDKLGGSFEFSPVISNGRVWATTRGRPSMIYAFDINNGDILLSKTACTVCGDAMYSPALSGGTLYFSGESISQSSSGAVAALDETAITGSDFKWVYSLPSGMNIRNTPSVHNDKVFIGAENPYGINGKGYLLALSTKDGSLLWKTDLPIIGQHFINSMPSVYANKVIIASRDESNNNHYVFAFNESSGEVLWQSEGIASGIGGPVSIADSKVFVSGADSGKINVFSTLNGKLLWSDTASGDVYSTPSIVNGIVYTGTTSVGGTNVIGLLKSDTTYEGSITLNSGAVTTIDASANSDVIVEITPNSQLLKSVSGNINISEFLQQTDLAVGVSQLNKYVEIKADTAILLAMANATIKIYYTDDELAAASIDESSLKLYSVATNGSLTESKDTGVDKVNNFVYGTTTSFSSYGTAGTVKDYDNDGIADSNDNCVSASNAGQSDSDQEGVGDACDNCPGAANLDQRDTDDDKLGNACDDDDDNDRVPDIDRVTNISDNCRIVANVNQSDVDGDGIGDVCDNCIAIANADQSDTDKDGHGNACDICKTIIGGYADASSNIKDMITAIDNAIMAKGTKNTLTAKLDGAVSALGRDQITNAIRKLDSFSDTIFRLSNQGKLGSGSESNEGAYTDLFRCTDAIKGQLLT